MGVIAALFSLKVPQWIAASRPLLIIPGPETLHTRSRFNERAIGAEVLVAYPLLLAGNLHDRGKEETADMMLKGPFLVLAEGACIKRLLIRGSTQKPLEEQIVLRPLPELPVTPH